MSVEFAPPDTGTYVLILTPRNSATIAIGKLGTLAVEDGFYLYTGSAFGPGGLRARIGHHQRSVDRRPHWHIDYLRQHAELIGVFFTTSTDRLEHKWAQTLDAQPCTRLPLLGFGSSDCGCLSHLFHTIQQPMLMDWLGPTITPEYAYQLCDQVWFDRVSPMLR